MSTPRFLVLPAGWEQAPLIQAAKRRGRVLAIDPNPNAEGGRHADEFAVGDSRDLPRLCALAQEFGATAFATDACDYSTYATAVLAARFGRPGPTLLAGAVGSNKRLQRERCHAAGVRQPLFRLARTIDEARRAVDEVGLPAIAKPIDSRGAFGVTKIEERGQIEQAVLDALMHSHSREILIEQFIDGEMFTVEGFGFGPAGHRSLTHSWKEMLPGRTRVALELTYPPSHVSIEDRLYAVNDRVAAACGFETGPTHAEYLVTATGDIYLVEIANRGSGVLISPLAVPILTGFDPSEAILDLAEGRVPPPAVSKPRDASVVLSFLVFPEGQATAFEGVDDAARLPGILSFRVTAAPGAWLPKPVDALTRHGLVLSHGRTRQEALDAASRARQAVTAVYADGSRHTARAPIGAAHRVTAS